MCTHLEADERCACAAGSLGYDAIALGTNIAPPALRIAKVTRYHGGWRPHLVCQTTGTCSRLRFDNAINDSPPWVSCCDDSMTRFINI